MNKFNKPKGPADFFPAPPPAPDRPIFVQSDAGTYQDSGQTWEATPPALGERIPLKTPSGSALYEVVQYKDGPGGILYVRPAKD